MDQGRDAQFDLGAVLSRYTEAMDRGLAALKETSAKRVSTLINTHWHPEQTGSNERLGKAGAKIIAPLVEAWWCRGKRVGRKRQQDAGAKAGSQQSATGRALGESGGFIGTF